MTTPRSSQTRNALIEAALRRFAARGFYGTSIAEIARELDITKQALLHHFPTKEALYGEVLAGVSGRLTTVMEGAIESDQDKALVEVTRALFAYFEAQNNDARVILRELLDNSERADQSRRWYLREFLDRLVQLARRHPNWANASEAQILAGIYHLVGAINYFAVSSDTLRNMYGAYRFDALREAFPEELQRLVESRQD